MNSIRSRLRWVLPVGAAVVVLWPGAAGPVRAEAAAARVAWQAFEESIGAAEQARQAGDFEESEARYLEAIERARPFGAQNMRLGRALDGLADLLYALERYEEAEPRYLEALEIWDKLLGTSQPRVATTMHNLAALYLARGEPERAEPLFVRSRRIWEESLGLDSPEVAISLNAHAALLQRTGRLQEAQRLIERARSIRVGSGLTFSRSQEQ